MAKRVHRYDKLDNTAHLFPVITGESMSNVYRVAAVLKEDVDPELLQQALDTVLPYFEVFGVRMRKGLFWHYFETNVKPAPKVKEEHAYPCRYINPYDNNDYQFRLSYYKKRVNLEVFHVLTDGNGALMFLKEIIYQYLRYLYPKPLEEVDDCPVVDTSLDNDDRYLRNYRQSAKKTYKTDPAFVVSGQKMPGYQIGVIHGRIQVEQIKKVAKAYGVTINHYLVGTFVWSVYKSFLQGKLNKPIRVCVPVNLRPYFDSDTTKNFFVIVSAAFTPTKEQYTFEEVLQSVAESLRTQITKENLENLMAYNVSNEMNPLLRAVPLGIKGMAMRIIYKNSARANTTTITNLGVVSVAEPYREYIDEFHAVLSMSRGQHIKGAVCSYGNKLVFTFSSHLYDTTIQKIFFRQLVSDGCEVEIETNGAYYE